MLNSKIGLGPHAGNFTNVQAGSQCATAKRLAEAWDSSDMSESLLRIVIRLSDKDMDGTLPS